MEEQVIVRKKRKPRVPRVVVSIPLVDPVIDKAVAELLPDLIFKVAGGEAVYRHISKVVGVKPGELPIEGKCTECGIDLYSCISHPIRADQQVGKNIAVFTTGAANEPPIPYCIDHDPTAPIRAQSGQRVDGMVVDISKL